MKKKLHEFEREQGKYMEVFRERGGKGKRYHLKEISFETHLKVCGSVCDCGYVCVCVLSLDPLIDLKWNLPHLFNVVFIFT